MEMENKKIKFEDFQYLSQQLKKIVYVYRSYMNTSEETDKVLNYISMISSVMESQNFTYLGIDPELIDYTKDEEIEL